MAEAAESAAAMQQAHQQHAEVLRQQREQFQRAMARTCSAGSSGSAADTDSPPAGPPCHPPAASSLEPALAPVDTVTEAVLGIEVVMPLGCSITQHPGGGGGLTICGPDVHVQLLVRRHAGGGVEAVLLSSTCVALVKRGAGRCVVTVHRPLVARAHA